jgi:hypothetical protein
MASEAQFSLRNARRKRAQARKCRELVALLEKDEPKMMLELLAQELERDAERLDGGAGTTAERRGQAKRDVLSEI